MNSPDRIFSGRKANLPGQPWARAAKVRGPVLPGVDAATQVELAARKAAEATRLAEVLRLAGERGYEAGRSQGEADLASAVAAARALARSLETAVPRDVDMVARTVAELSVLVARRILAAELRHDPARSILADLTRPAAGGTVTLVYGARDDEHNGAVVLRDAIEDALWSHAP